MTLRQVLTIGVVTLGLAVVGLGVGRGQEDLTGMVQGFFPTEMRAIAIEDAAREEIEPVLESAFIEVDGQRVIAAYSNGRTGAVRLLTLENGSWGVKYDAQEAFVGRAAEVTLLDVDGDGQNEAWVSFLEGMESWDWVFEIGAAQLRRLTPVAEWEEDGKRKSLVRGASAEDVDGDGVVELVQRYQSGTEVDDIPGDVARKPFTEVFIFVGGQFVATGASPVLRGIVEELRLAVVTSALSDRRKRSFVRRVDRVANSIEQASVARVLDGDGAGEKKARGVLRVLEGLKRAADKEQDADVGAIQDAIEAVRVQMVTF